MRHTTQSITLKPTYTVPELARLCGMTRQSMGRLLIRIGVPVIPGRPRRVALNAFRQGAPDLWASIIEVQCFQGFEDT